MKQSRKILGMVVGTLVFLGSSATVKADVLINNCNANNSCNYKILSYKTCTDNQSTNCKNTQGCNTLPNMIFKFFNGKTDSNVVTIPKCNTCNTNLGTGTSCKNGGTCTGTNTSCSNGSTCTGANTSCSNGSTCVGANTSCKNGSTCTGTATKPSNPGNTGTESTTKPSNSGSTTTGTTQQNNKGISAEEKKLFDLINQERQKAGVTPLQIDEKVFKAARIKSQDMNDKSYFSHTSPTFGSSTTLLKNEGVSYRYFGENIAKNYNVESAHNSLMNSDGHRKNILNPNYTHVGIGIVNGYYTEIFIGK